MKNLHKLMRKMNEKFIESEFAIAIIRIPYKYSYYIIAFFRSDSDEIRFNCFHVVFRIKLKAKANPLALALALLIFLGPLVLVATKG